MGSGIVKGAIFGGIIVYVWMIVSWMVIPWHQPTMMEFKNARYMAAAITENCHRDGIYVMPQEKDNTNRVPFVFAAVKLGGNPMGAGNFIASIIVQVIGAGFISYFLSRSTGMVYVSKVFFVTFIGFVAWLLGMFPGWIWMGMSGGYILVALADLVIGWFLAGLVLAAVVRTR